MKVFLSAIALLLAASANAAQLPAQGKWTLISINNRPTQVSSFLKVYADGTGFMCSSDEDSVSWIDIEGNEMSYNNGVEQIEVSGNTMVAVGEEKGETYSLEYARVSSVPDWCDQQEQDDSAD